MRAGDMFRYQAKQSRQGRGNFVLAKTKLSLTIAMSNLAIYQLLKYNRKTTKVQFYKGRSKAKSPGPVNIKESSITAASEYIMY